MGKSTISMVIFNSYVKLPKGNKWTFRAKHRNRKVFGIMAGPVPTGLVSLSFGRETLLETIRLMIEAPVFIKLSDRGTGFHQAIHPLYNCKDHHAEFHHVLPPLKYCNVCTVIKPNEAFLSHGGSPNHPVVMDDHDLVLKQAW